MSLTVFNGSPRGKASNSSAITGWFTEGYGSVDSSHYITHTNKRQDHLDAFLRADDIFFVFPLYVDGMPGQVKAFIEALIPHKEAVKGKSITFCIHSGFGEGIQNRALERYLNRFAEIFQLDNQGVIIAPGSEGFRLMPPQMTKKKHAAMAALGKAYKEKRPYERSLIEVLNPNETFGKGQLRLQKLMARLGLSNMYWNQNLKKHNAFDKRFDAPYKDGPIKVTSPGYTRNY